MKKRLLLGLAIITCTSFTVGAATGGKITAYLNQQKIVCNGSTSTKQVISYNSSTYVPLREFANMVGVNVNYQDGTIFVGDNTGSTATTTTYSRTNPAPIGTTQAITVKDYIDNYKAEVCVKEVIRGDAAWQKIKEANMFNDEAENGKEYILAKISVKAISIDEDKKLDVSRYNFKCYSASNMEYSDLWSVVEPEPTLGGSIYTGASTEGWVAFQVDKTDLAPKIVYGQSYDGTGGIWFSLK